MRSRSLLLLLPFAALLASCQRESQVDRATREGILIVANSNEPKGLDPHIVSGVLESNLLRSMFEGLVRFDERDDSVSPPGAAAELVPDETATVWTAHMRPNGRWSDGEPVTAEDFAFSYQRMLTPELGAKYADMLYFLDGAEVFNRGQRGRILFERSPRAGDPPWEELEGVAFAPDATVSAPGGGWETLSEQGRLTFVRARGLDALERAQLEWIAERPAERYPWPAGFAHADTLLGRMIASFEEDLWQLARVGVEVVDPLTLRLTLRGPTPYFPELLKHYTWTAVPKHVVLRHGSIGQRGNPWTRAENIVGNGPFQMKSWRLNDHIEVERNPHYWDAENVTLNGIRFLPITNLYTEARMFRNEQLHVTYSAPSEVVDLIQRENPSVLRQEPYTGTIFYRFNTTREPLQDPRVRQALTLAVDRQAICDNVFRGYEPAYAITPPMGDYQPPRVAEFNPERARELLAEAGFPGGEGFPRLKILIATRETSDTLAQAMQAMWRRHLGVEVEIENKEWTAYLVAQQQMDYDIAGAGWIGDYLDPLTFLEMWSPGGGNNNTGWTNDRFMEILQESFQEADPARRLVLLEQAERIFLEDAPVAVLCWYVKNYLIHPSVENWNPKLLDNRPYQFVRLRPQEEKR